MNDDWTTQYERERADIVAAPEGAEQAQAVLAAIVANPWRYVLSVACKMPVKGVRVTESAGVFRGTLIEVPADQIDEIRNRLDRAGLVTAANLCGISLAGVSIEVVVEPVAGIWLEGWPPTGR